MPFNFAFFVSVKLATFACDDEKSNPKTICFFVSKKNAFVYNDNEQHADGRDPGWLIEMMMMRRGHVCGMQKLGIFK